MMKRFKRWQVVTVSLAAFAGAIYLNNASWLADPIGNDPYLVAHRALGQAFDREGLTGKTCTASRMISTGHEYLENTIPSMRAAFDFGADAIEIDVHRTVDERFAVFHDWTVACRTEGDGATREHTLEELQVLDVGYGYTADGGDTFPFRGRGVGMIPSLAEVMETFPDRDFFLDVKSNDASEGALLAARLEKLVTSHGGEIAVFGGPRPVGIVRERVPGVRTITRPRLKRCVLRYLAVGWTGHVPADCREAVLFVPVNVAPWLWGWPNRFLSRMDRVGSRVVLIGDYGGEVHSKGFDDPAQLSELPRTYPGGIMTDRIDLIGPAVASR